MSVWKEFWRAAEVDEVGRGAMEADMKGDYTDERKCDSDVKPASICRRRLRCLD